MFMFGQESWIMTLAAIIATWVIVSFLIVAAWVVIIEINAFVNNYRNSRATAKLFQEVEEIQNDFN